MLKKIRDSQHRPFVEAVSKRPSESVVAIHDTPAGLKDWVEEAVTSRPIPERVESAAQAVNYLRTPVYDRLIILEFYKEFIDWFNHQLTRFLTYDWLTDWPNLMTDAVIGWMTSGLTALCLIGWLRWPTLCLIGWLRWPTLCLTFSSTWRGWSQDIGERAEWALSSVLLRNSGQLCYYTFIIISSLWKEFGGDGYE